MKDDRKPFGAENIRGAEYVKGAENTRSRENIVGAEDRPAKGRRETVAQVASSLSAAAENLNEAAKLLEKLGFAAMVNKVKGEPIELWGKDESLQELADRLNTIAESIKTEPRAPAE